LHSLSIHHLFTLSYTPAIYVLTLHDALPISCDRDLGEFLLSYAASRGTDMMRALGHRAPHPHRAAAGRHHLRADVPARRLPVLRDRKSTRLNSSHVKISYDVFCLKKKN